MSGLNVTTRFYDGINYTPAVPLLARAQFELMESGHAQPGVLMFWDDQAIVGSVNAVPVGVVSFGKPWGRIIEIRIGYVLPEYRQQGVYRRIWDALVLKAQELDVVQITSTTHINNTVMHTTAEHLGRELAGYIIRYVVPGKAS